MYMIRLVMSSMHRPGAVRLLLPCRGSSGSGSTLGLLGHGLCMMLVPHLVSQGLHVHPVVPVS